MSHKLHRTSHAQRILGVCVSILFNGGLLALIALSSGSSAHIDAASDPSANKIFCRYIDNGRLFRIEVEAADWQEAEDRVCGGSYREVRLGQILRDGAALILGDTDNPIVMAQRESCTCSDEDRVPILQDIGIVEAPRLGAETKKTALPRIINTPEPSQSNVVTTKPPPTPPKPPREKPRKLKPPSIDDLINAASDFDEARPVSEVDPGGSIDGSRLSKSATGKGDPYLQKIKAKLDNTMNAPASVPKSELKKLSANVWMKIGDGGVVWAWDFQKKSGNAPFDKMIEMTLKQFMTGGALRFAPPTPQWKLQKLYFTVSGKDIR